MFDITSSGYSSSFSFGFACATILKLVVPIEVGCGNIVVGVAPLVGSGDCTGVGVATGATAELPFFFVLLFAFRFGVTVVLAAAAALLDFRVDFFLDFFGGGESGSTFFDVALLDFLFIFFVGFVTKLLPTKAKPMRPITPQSYLYFGFDVL
jgi:hypothetical protein